MAEIPGLPGIDWTYTQRKDFAYKNQQFKSLFIENVKATREKIFSLYPPLLSDEQMAIITDFANNGSIADGLLYYPPIENPEPWYSWDKTPWKAAYGYGASVGAFDFLAYQLPVVNEALLQNLRVKLDELGKLIYTLSDFSLENIPYVQVILRQRGDGRWNADRPDFLDAQKEALAALKAEHAAIAKQYNDELAKTSEAGEIFSQHRLIFGLVYYHYATAATWSLSNLTHAIWYVQQYGSEIMAEIANAQQQTENAKNAASAQAALALTEAQGDAAQVVSEAQQKAALLRVDLSRDVDAMLQRMQIVALLLNEQVK